MTTDELVIHWYALKVFFNKVFEVEESLKAEDVECYVPCENVAVERNGERKVVRKPMISSLLFFRSTERRAIDLQQMLSGRAMLYTRVNEFQKIPVAIPEQEMNVFMLVCSSGETGLEYLGNDSVEFYIGERVRVTDGPFKGAEGYIRRVKRNRRLIVTVKGICAVATSYIPQCFLQKIEG